MYKEAEKEAERVVANLKYLTKTNNNEPLILSELAFKLAISYFGEKWAYVVFLI